MFTEAAARACVDADAAQEFERKAQSGLAAAQAALRSRDLLAVDRAPYALECAKRAIARARIARATHERRAEKFRWHAANALRLAKRRRS